MLYTQAFEDEVRSKGTGVNRSLHRLFDTLAGRGTTAYTGTILCNVIICWGVVHVAVVIT